MPENNSSGPVFNEVLGVSIDLQNFAAQCDRLAQVWEQKLKAMSTASKSNGNGLLDPLFKLAQAISQIDDATKKAAQSDAVLWKQRNQSAKAYAQYLSLTKQQQDKISGQATPVSRFWNGLTQNISSSLGVMTRYVVGVSLVLKTLEAVRSAFDGIVGAFEQGINHLREIQTRTTNVKEALLENVVYSKDFVTNFQKAGTAAQFVSEEIEKIAPQLSLAPQKLEASFKALVQGGGLKMVNGDLSQAVLLAGQLMSVMRSRGVEQQRRAITEINQLMTGQVKSASALLQVLGYTPAQWHKIRQEALANGNLVALISDKLAAVNERLSTAGTRWNEVSASVTEYKKQFLGAMSEALFRTLLGYLQQVKTYFESHRTQLFEMARLLGENVARMFAFGTEATKAQNPVLAMLTAFGHLAIYLEGMVDSLKASAGLVGRLFSSDEEAATSKKAWEAEMAAVKAREAGDKAAVKSAQERLEAAKNEAEFARQRRDMENAQDLGSYKLREADREARHKQLDEARAAFNKPFIGPMPEEAQSPTPIGYTDKASGGDAKQQVSAAKELYEAQLAAEREYLQEQTALLEEAHARNELSEKDFANKMIAQLQASRTRVDAIAKESLAKIAGMGGLTDEQRKALSNVISKQQAKEDARLDSETSKQRQAISKDEEDRTMAHLRRELQARKELASAEVTLARETGQRETDVVDLEIAAREDAFVREKAILEKELAAAKENAAERERINDELVSLNARHNVEIETDDARRHKAQLDDATQAAKVQEDANNRAVSSLENQIAVEELEDASRSTRIKHERQLIAAKVETISKNMALIQSVLDVADAMHLEGKDVDALRKHYEDLANEKDKAAHETVEPTKTQQTMWSVFGGGRDPEEEKNFQTLGDYFDNWNKGVQSFASGVQFFQGVVGNFVGAIQQGIAQGGTLGGIGAGLQQAGGLISMLPGVGQVAGAVMSIAGSVASMFGSLFGNKAKEIAKDISTDFNNTIAKYQGGQMRLIDAEREVEKERADAISRLSGIKGGDAELAKLLPEFDKELASLEKEREQIMITFKQQLAALRMHSTTLGDIANQWRDIVKQAQDYFDATNDAAQTQEFLKLNLEKIKEDTQQGLNEGEQNAIQDALTLNDLLQQRLKLTQDWKKTEFEATTGDAVERHQSYAVKTAEALASQRADYEKQLADLDSQISLTGKKVDMEKTVFKIASDINALHRQDEQLQLAAFDLELKKLADMKKIVEGINRGGGPLNGPFGGVFQGIDIGTIVLNVGGSTTTVSTKDAGVAKAANDLVAAIRTRQAFGHS